MDRSYSLLTLLGLFLLLLLLLPGCALEESSVPEPSEPSAEEVSSEEPATNEASLARQAAHYPLEVCLVSQEPLAPATETVIGDRLFRTCCGNCADEVKKDAERWTAELDQAVIAAQLPDYPSQTCPISEQPIDSMGGPLDVVIEGRLVRLCCDGCVKSFEKKADEYFAALDEEAAQAAGSGD